LIEKIVGSHHRGCKGEKKKKEERIFCMKEPIARASALSNPEGKKKKLLVLLLRRKEV